MRRSQRCEDGNRIQLSGHEAANASLDYRPRREQATSLARLTPEFALECGKTIGEIALPDRGRRRSPIDADRDRQFDLRKETARPIPKAPGAVQQAHWAPCVLTRTENCRCLPSTRPINGRPTWVSRFATAATRTRCSTAASMHRAHERLSP